MALARSVRSARFPIGVATTYRWPSGRGTSEAFSMRAERVERLAATGSVPVSVAVAVRARHGVQPRDPVLPWHGPIPSLVAGVLRIGFIQAGATGEQGSDANQQPAGRDVSGMISWKKQWSRDGQNAGQTQGWTLVATGSVRVVGVGGCSRHGIQGRNPALVPRGTITAGCFYPADWIHPCWRNRTAAPCRQGAAAGRASFRKVFHGKIKKFVSPGPWPSGGAVRGGVPGRARTRFLMPLPRLAARALENLEDQLGLLRHFSRCVARMLRGERMAGGRL